MAATSTQTERRTRDLGTEIVNLEAAFKKDPKAGLALAEAYLTDGRPKDALRVLEKSGAGSNADRALLMANAHFDLFDNASAQAELKKATSNGNLDGNLRAQLLFGELAFEDGKAEAAKKHFRKALSLDERNRRAAEMLRNLGEPVEVPEEDDAPLADVHVTDEVAIESGGRAALHLGIGIVAGVIFLGLYVWYTQNTHEVKTLVAEARPIAEAGDVLSLQAAAQKYQSALDVRGGDEHALAGLADVYATLWGLHGLESARERARELTARVADDDIEKAERFSAEMLAAYGDGEYAKVEQIAEDVLKKGGVSEKIYFPLGLAQRALGKPRPGRDNLRRAQDLRSGVPHYATALGDAYDDDNDARNAAFYWELGYKANSNYVQAHARHLLARIRRGENPAVLAEDVVKLQELPPERLGKRDRATVLFTQSALAYRQGDTGKAAELINEAIALDGETPRRLMMLGQVQLAERKPEEAIAAYKKAHELQPTFERYFYGLAEAYTRTSQIDLAIKTLESRKERFIEHAPYYVTLGDAYTEKGDQEQATAAYDKALELHKDYPEAFLGHGVLAWRNKDYEKAAEWFGKAVTARPNFPEVYEAVGLMWIEQGAVAEADPNLAKAEHDFRNRGADAVRMNEFYAKVITAYAAAKGGSSFVKKWVDREKAYRTGG